MGLKGSRDVSYSGAVPGTAAHSAHNSSPSPHFDLAGKFGKIIAGSLIASQVSFGTRLPAAVSLRAEKDGGLSPSIHSLDHLIPSSPIHWGRSHGVAMTFRLGHFFDESNNEKRQCTSLPQRTHKDERFGRALPEPHRPVPYIRNHGMEGQAPLLAH